MKHGPTEPIPELGPVLEVLLLRRADVIEVVGAGVVEKSSPLADYPLPDGALCEFRFSYEVRDGNGKVTFRGVGPDPMGLTVEIPITEPGSARAALRRIDASDAPRYFRLRLPPSAGGASLLVYSRSYDRKYRPLVEPGTPIARFDIPKVEASQ